MRINSRSKGQRGEREVRDILQFVMDGVGREMDLPFIPEVKRNLMQSMEGGHDLVGVPGLAVEVKFCENLQLDKWWEQCTRQAERDGGMPVLIYRKKNVKWKVRANARLDGDAEPYTVDMSLDQYLHWFEGHLKRTWSKGVPTNNS